MWKEANQLSLLERVIARPAWVFDILNPRVVWANELSLEIWDADDVPSLLARDFATDMSEATRVRLEAYLPEFAQGRTVRDQWTFYPRGGESAITVDALCSGIPLEDGSTGMLFIVVGRRDAADDADPTLRLVEAIRHTKAAVALVRDDGEVIMRNPHAQSTFGEGSAFGDWFGQRAGMAFLDHCRREGTAVAELRGSGGEDTQWYSVDARTTRDPVTATNATLLWATDVTRRRTAERALADRERRLSSLSARLQEVLDHMRQAILVFAEDGVLEEVVSRRTAALFGAAAVQGAHVASVLFPDAQRYDAEASAFRDWVAVVVGAEIELWPQLASLAPRELETRGEPRRTLELGFQPIPDEEGRIGRVMMLATDVTSERKMRSDFLRSDAARRRQIRAMRQLLTGGGQRFLAFVESVKLRLADCANALSNRSGRSNLVQVYHGIHSIRAEAAVFDLPKLESAARDLEAYLEDLKRSGRTDTEANPDRLIQAAHDAVGEALEVFVAASPIGKLVLDQMTVRRSDVEHLIEAIRGHDEDLAEQASRLLWGSFGETVGLLSETATEWAEREGKRVRLEVVGKESLLPPSLCGVLPTVLSHLVRNAIAHGVEPPRVREEMGKDPVGTISLQCSGRGQSVKIEVRDDGAGVNLDVLRTRAETVGVSVEDNELPFADGLSARDEDGSLAGRGVGLSAVRATLEEIGFRVDWESNPSRGTVWTVGPIRGDLWMNDTYC